MNAIISFVTLFTIFWEVNAQEIGHSSPYTLSKHDQNQAVTAESPPFHQGNSFQEGAKSTEPFNFNTDPSPETNFERKDQSILNKVPGTYRRVSINSRMIDIPSLEGSPSISEPLSLLVQDTRKTGVIKEDKHEVYLNEDNKESARFPKRINGLSHQQDQEKNTQQLSTQPINLFPLSELFREQLDIYVDSPSQFSEERPIQTKPVITLPLRPSFSFPKANNAGSNNSGERKSIESLTQSQPVLSTDHFSSSFDNGTFSDLPELSHKSNSEDQEESSFQFEETDIESSEKVILINEDENINGNSSDINSNVSSTPPPINPDFDSNSSSATIANNPGTSFTPPPATSPYGLPLQPPPNFGNPSHHGGIFNFNDQNFGLPSPDFSFGSGGLFQAPAAFDQTPGLGDLGINYDDILKSLGLDFTPDPLFRAQPPLFPQLYGGGSGNENGFQNFGQFEFPSFLQGNVQGLNN